MGAHHRLGPGDRRVVGGHLQAQVQEAIAAALENLRAVDAVPERPDIPWLTREEGRSRAEGRGPVLQPAIMKLAEGEAVGAGMRDVGGWRVAAVGPVGIIVMIAGDDRKGQLAIEHREAAAGDRPFDRQRARIGGQMPFDDRIGDRAQATGGMVGVHAAGGMLPDVADCGREDDIAALRPGVARDERHLLIEEFARVEGEAGLRLMLEIGVVLGVGNDRDGEAGVVGALRGRGDGGRQGKGGEKGLETHDGPLAGWTGKEAGERRGGRAPAGFRTSRRR